MLIQFLMNNKLNNDVIIISQKMCLREEISLKLSVIIKKRNRRYIRYLPKLIWVSSNKSYIIRKIQFGWNSSVSGRMCSASICITSSSTLITNFPNSVRGVMLPWRYIILNLVRTRCPFELNRIYKRDFFLFSQCR